MKKKLIVFILICLSVLAVYGTGRLYYAVTAGFSLSNITSDKPYEEKWSISPLSSIEKEQLQHILSQKFYYLGKGCQSYVFGSEDGQYVLKFVKYQRFRPQAWLDIFKDLPIIGPYRLTKIEKKRKKLDMLFSSWKTAYDHLKNETGLIYIHLNKSTDMKQTVTIYDKIGLAYQLNLDEIEFLLQKRVNMLCPTLTHLMEEGHLDQAQELMDHLLDMILSEYKRGLADNDHALMQNTGALGRQAFHIDVGQFVIRPEITHPEIYKKELFSKTYKLHKWLSKHHPELGNYLKSRLLEIIGPEFHTLVPQVKNPHAWSVEVQ